MGRVVSEFGRRGASVRRVQEGDSVDFADGLRLSIVFPDEELIVGSESDTNNNSLVTRATFGRFSALLPGDLQQEAEEELMRERLDIRSDVVKIPHHGSNRGAGTEFLRAVGARTAIISVGEGNSFGHPAPSTLARLAQLGIEVHRTDLEGDVELTTDGLTQSIGAEKR